MDSGSQQSFIISSYAKRLALEQYTHIPVYDLGIAIQTCKIIKTKL